MNKSLDEAEVTIFDIETTGLEPKAGDRVVEIAAIRFKARERTGTFHSLVNPHRRISEAAFAVNKITPQMLKGAPDIAEVLPGFLSFIKDSCLCSYNAGFDLEFLHNEIQFATTVSLEDVIVVDILKMAKRLMPGLERYALWFVAKELGFQQKQQHRALSDVELTTEVFFKLKEILQTKGISDFMSFSRLFSIKHRFLDDLITQRLAQIQEAIELGVKLKIKYLSSSAIEVTEREVIPRAIKQENNHNYLVGYCCLRSQERTFRIDGILHLEII